MKRKALLEVEIDTKDDNLCCCGECSHLDCWNDWCDLFRCGIFGIVLEDVTRTA